MASICESCGAEFDIGDQFAVDDRGVCACLPCFGQSGACKRDGNVGPLDEQARARVRKLLGRK